VLALVLCSRTKLMDLMVAKEMARRFYGSGIEVRCSQGESRPCTLQL
jgi:hypothetical protein